MRQGQETIIKSSLKYAVAISALGYALIVGSAVVVSIIVRLITGYYPSFIHFTLALITFRLVEIHYGFLVLPPLVAIFMMMILSRTPINRRIAAGLSLNSYYLLVAFIYLIVGAGDFPMESSIPWLLLVFVVGFGASVIVDKVCAQYSPK